MTWLAWGHLASFALVVPVEIACELGRLSFAVPHLIAASNVAVFFAFTFWRLPDKRGLPYRVAFPIGLALIYYIASYASTFRQQDLCWSSLMGVPLGSVRYVLAVLDLGATEYFLALLGLVVVYFCAANVPRPSTFGYLLFFSAFGGVMLGMIVHINGFPHIVRGSSGYTLSVTRLDVLGQNPNGTGTLMLLYGALGYALLGPTRQRMLRVALITGLVILAVCLILTLTRGAWLGLAAMIAVGPALMRTRQPWKLPMIAFMVSVAAFWLLLLLHFRTLPGDTLAGRTGIWRDALRVFATHPLFGTGLETQLVQNPGSRALTHAHNAFLNLLAEAGVVGTFLILWASAAICGMLWRIAAKGRDMLVSAQALGALLGLVGMVTADLVNVEWRREPVRLFVTVLLAAVLGAARNRRAGSVGMERPQSRVTFPESTKEMWLDQAETTGLPVTR